MKKKSFQHGKSIFKLCLKVLDIFYCIVAVYLVHIFIILGIVLGTLELHHHYKIGSFKICICLKNTFKTISISVAYGTMITILQVFLLVILLCLPLYYIEICW